MFLNEDEVQSFIQNGYTIAKGVFPASLAERAVNELWNAMPEDRNDPNTWNRPGFLLQHSMRDSVYPKLFTDKLKSAISDLLGEDRWTEAGRLEYHPIKFPNSEHPWSFPSSGWHVDGSWFHHYLDGVFQPLVLLPTWIDIESRGGATVVKPGSHKRAARIVADAGTMGLNNREISARAVEACTGIQPAEVLPKAGDVVLMHHFTLHAGSANCGTSTRMISNMYVHLKQRACFERPDGVYSPYERAIVAALERKEQQCQLSNYNSMV